MRTWAAVVACGLLIVSVAERTYAQPWTWQTVVGPADRTGVMFRGVSGSSVFGYYNDSTGQQTAFVYDGTTWTDLSLNYPGSLSNSTKVTGISGNTLLGNYQPDRTAAVGFAYDGVNWTTFSPPSTMITMPMAMSGNTITGFYMTQSLVTRGFVYDGTTMTTVAHPGTNYTAVAGLLGSTIVGDYRDVSGNYQGFTYDGGTWADLNYPGATWTLVKAVSGNRVLGQFGYGNYGSSNTHGFLFDGTTWTSIDFPGAVATQAYGLWGNTIVGNYTFNGTNYQPFILTLPEPATVSLLALGGLLLGGRRAGRCSALILLAAGLVASGQRVAPADVLNLGGTRHADGSWTGLASLETVPVGDRGNIGNPSGVGAGGWGPDRICGAVGYDYRIGKYEVTAGQYVEFLNKVAGVDTHGLYNTKMWTDEYGCRIERFTGNGTAGDPYQYRVLANWANRPVNFVSFWSACRFANWLHNGQPSGVQDNATTEDGAYTLTSPEMANNTVGRNANWKWAVTSEDEWYKAAYYDPHKPDGAGYWSYPMGSDSVPSNDLLTPDGGNNANFWQDYGCTIGGSYYRTPVGEFELSDSPYGTFDQGGNVWEWNETAVSGSHRVARGGFFNGDAGNLNALYRYDGASPANGSGSLGFRVVFVPEPASLSLLVLGGLLLAQRRRRIPHFLTVTVLAAAMFAARPDVASASVFSMGPGLTSLETVLVGDPGNVGELSGQSIPRGYGPDRICGAVDYTYRMGKYEVTAGQYCAFLNAVAGIDTYGLYSPYMWSYDRGCKIERSGGGTQGDPYTYSVAAERANRPVAQVSWADATRFANWLHNGQPTGPQDASTTEDGAYALNGATSRTALQAVVRKPGAKWVVPTEDEWYKAAYYKGGSTNGGYWGYPTGSNNLPGRDLDDVSGNNANYYLGSGTYPIDSGMYTTTVGEFENSGSPYGTFDQGGNVWEWNETVIVTSWEGSCRGVRGGSFHFDGNYLHAGDRYLDDPAHEDFNIGFRVALVPEPATLSLIALGGLLITRRRRV